jgi:hypothetical protein
MERGAYTQKIYTRLQTIGINTPQYFDISFIESSREKPSMKFVVLNTKRLLQGMIIAAGRLSFIKKLNLAKRTTFLQRITRLAKRG